MYTRAGICAAYASVEAAYKNAVASQPNQQALANLLGASLRMAFHDAVDLDLTQPDLMGADGCIGDSQGSAGLVEPDTSPIYTVMEPIYQANCDKINRADFFVLFAKFVVEKSEPTGYIQLPFQYGRRETQDCSAGGAGIGRDPDAQDGFAAIKQAFITQMGLSYTDAGNHERISYIHTANEETLRPCFCTVTLSGAHTIGHVHASGYNGHPGADMAQDPTVNAWDLTPTQFDNGYFVQMLEIVRGAIHKFSIIAYVNIFLFIAMGDNLQ